MSWLVDFVKEKEGYREKAYQDSVGVWTIGYGNTRIMGRAVKQHDVVTKPQAEMMLEAELHDFLNYVIEYRDKVGYDWNNKQVAALTSFIYNLGKGALNQVTQDGTRDNETIAEKMLLYVNAGGKPLPGLVTRRKEESDHFKGE